MKREKIWQVKAYDKGRDSVVGLYSSKREVFKSLKIWEGNSSNPFVIREDISKMNQVRGSEIIHLDYKFGKTVIIFVNRTTFNNGSKLSTLGRENAWIA